MMTDNHTELCKKLREEIALFKVARINPGQIVPALAMIEQQAARIQQQALEYVSLFDQYSEALAKIAELERERDALKADVERWREFAEHQTWCADCGESVSTCPIGSRLQKAALQAEKETRS